MRFDDFLSSPRWEILELIARKPMSPIELAEKLGTTVSYMSQQLKLLDAAGIVLREKTGAALKGKPRTLFSISKEVIYLTALARGFSKKKLIALSDYHKSILNIWLLEDESLHFFFEKLFWKLQENIKEVNGIFIDNSSAPRLLILSDSKQLKTKIGLFVKTFEKKIDYSFVTLNSLNKIPLENLFSLYGKQDVLTELKGGEE
ncbi:MAG: ArsR family transcriptional regulator [Candidatus Pacearchaeota archaeon]|jgi:hypothetical protein